MELVQSGVWAGLGFGAVLLMYAVTTSDLVVRYVRTTDASGLSSKQQEIVPYPSDGSTSMEHVDLDDEEEKGEQQPSKDGDGGASNEENGEKRPVDVAHQSRDDVTLVVPQTSASSCLDSCLCCCGVCLPNLYSGTCSCTFPHVQYVTETRVADKSIMRSCVDLFMVQGSSLHPLMVAYTTWTMVAQVLATGILRDIEWLTFAESVVMYTSSLALFFIGYAVRNAPCRSVSCISKYTRTILFAIYYGGALGAIENANYRHGSDGFFGLSMMIVASTLLMSAYIVLRVAAIDDPVFGQCGCMHLPTSGRLKWSRIFVGIQGLALLCPQVVLALLIGTPGIDILRGSVGRLLPG